MKTTDRRASEIKAPLAQSRENSHDGRGLSTGDSDSAEDQILREKRHPHTTLPEDRIGHPTSPENPDLPNQGHDEPGYDLAEAEDNPAQKGAVDDKNRAPTQSEAGPVEAEGESDETPRKKRRTLAILALIAAVVGIPVGIYYYFYSLHFESTDDAFIEAHVVQVSPRVSGHVQDVFVQDNQLVKAGQLLFQLDPESFQAEVDEAQAQLNVAEANERQARIAVEVTSVTAQAAEREARSGYQAALAQVASSQAMVETSTKKVAEAEAAVATARARAKQAISAMESAKAEADRLTSDVARTRTLYQDNNVAREEYEHVLAQARAAVASYQAAQENAAALKAGVAQALASLRATSDTVQQARADVAASKSSAQQEKAKLAGASVSAEKIQSARAELDTAIANTKVARANLDSAKLNLCYTEVRAASDGRVTRKNVEPGNYVAAGQSVMALVGPKRWIVANFKENQIRYMTPGDEAEVEVDMLGNEKFRAHVDSVQAGTGARFSLLPPENATGNFVKVVQRVPVKLVFDEPSTVTARMAPGLSVEPTVTVR